MSTLTAREQARFDALAKKGGYAVSQKKTSRAKKVTKPATKGAQPVGKGALTRKQWNHTLTTKARLMGKRDDGQSWYAYVIAQWADVQEARTGGYTPDEVLAVI